MLKKQIYQFVIILSLLLAFTTVTSAAALSPNIPLDSPIYTYIDKLDGLGYLKEMQTGTKPYTRMEVAGWVKGIRERVPAAAELPEYAKTMLNRLITEFGPELAALNGETGARNLMTLRQVNLSSAYYDGEPLLQHHTKSTYHPLDINNNGYKLADGWNVIGSVELDGTAGDKLLYSLTPRLSLDTEEDATLSLESGYLKTYFKNLQIQLGKDPMGWGPGERGNLTLTNNMTPLTAIQLSTLEPVEFDGILKFLRQMDVNVFWADLEDHRDVSNPALVGFRADFTPRPNFTMGFALNSMVGGEGHEFHLSDLWDFILGNNAETKQDEKWNSIAGWDLRWRIPSLRGLQFYWQYYGEDQKDTSIPIPFKPGQQWGIYLPRLTSDGDWDLKMEVSRSSSVWYEHSLYTDGYTYKNNIIGDAMGNNAGRYYLKLTHYQEDGARLAFHAEQVMMDRNADYSQKVNSLWISYSRELADNLTLDATAGVADIDNLNYQKEQSDQNYLLSVGLTKKF